MFVGAISGQQALGLGDGLGAVGGIAETTAKGVMPGWLPSIELRPSDQVFVVGDQDPDGLVVACPATGGRP